MVVASSGAATSKPSERRTVNSTRSAGARAAPAPSRASRADGFACLRSRPAADGGDDGTRILRPVSRRRGPRWPQDSRSVIVENDSRLVLVALHDVAPRAARRSACPWLRRRIPSCAPSYFATIARSDTPLRWSGRPARSRCTTRTRIRLSAAVSRTEIGESHALDGGDRLVGCRRDGVTTCFRRVRAVAICRRACTG